MENQNNKFLKGIFFILLFFLTILCGMLLKVMADVFKPVVLAVLLSLVFYPFSTFLESYTSVVTSVSTLPASTS